MGKDLHVVNSKVPKRLVTQDNALINATYSMSLDEKRLLMLGISRIDSRANPNDTPCKFNLSVAEWRQYYQADHNGAYEQMAEASRRLMDRKVTIKDPEKAGKKRGVTVMQWVDKCHYLDGEARVEITFGASISGYLMGLARSFTKMELINVGGLSTLYSIRLYELLSQYRDTGCRVQMLDDLREMWEIEGLYSVFYDFKKRVIKPSIDEINEKTDLYVTIEPIKEGRAVAGLKFVIHEKEQLRLDL